MELDGLYMSGKRLQAAALGESDAVTLKALCAEMQAQLLLMSDRFAHDPEAEKRLSGFTLFYERALRVYDCAAAILDLSARFQACAAFAGRRKCEDAFLAPVSEQKLKLIATDAGDL